jgi:hypothetical protein
MDFALDIGGLRFSGRPSQTYPFQNHCSNSVLRLGV